MAGPLHPGLDAEAPAAAVRECFFLRNKARGSCCCVFLLRRVFVPSGDGARLEVKVKMCAWRRRRSSRDSPAFLSVDVVCVLLQGLSGARWNRVVQL